MKPQSIWVKSLLLLIGVTAALGTAVSAAGPKVSLAWTFTPGPNVSPGQQADRNFNTVDDAPWNSSFVVRVASDGKPSAGRVVSWKTSDPTGHIQSVASKTDAQGLARAWYFGGSAPKQVITAVDVRSKRSLTFNLKAVNPADRQGSRYLGTGMNSAEDKNWDAIRTVVRIDSAPKSTYYELAMSWARNRVNGDEGFYGGLQQLDCTAGTNAEYKFNVCGTARGKVSGRLAIFAAWGTKDSGGHFVTPKVVSHAEGGSCVPFDNEGSGMSCKVPADWTTSELWAWQVTRLTGAPAGWTRVAATVARVDGSEALTVATFDVPYEMALATNEQFVEDFARQSLNCLKTERRSMTIKAIGFLDGTTWHRATSQSYAYGWLNPCFNYQVREDADGVHLDAGGKAGWYDLWPALRYSAGGRAQGPGWSTADQSHDPHQSLTARTLLTY